MIRWLLCLPTSWCRLVVAFLQCCATLLIQFYICMLFESTHMFGFHARFCLSILHCCFASSNRYSSFEWCQLQINLKHYSISIWPNSQALACMAAKCLYFTLTCPVKVMVCTREWSNYSKSFILQLRSKHLQLQLQPCWLHAGWSDRVKILACSLQWRQELGRTQVIEILSYYIVIVILFINRNLLPAVSRPFKEQLFLPTICWHILSIVRCANVFCVGQSLHWIQKYLASMNQWWHQAASSLSSISLMTVIKGPHKNSVTGLAFKM